MTRSELFLVGATYHSEEGGVVVDLFGRTPEGRSMTARVIGFEPYFILVEPTSDQLSQLRSDPDFKRLSDLTLWVGGRERPCVKVTITYPWLVPQFRDRYRKPEGTPDSEFSVLSCDIPFTHRFLYDQETAVTLAFESEPETEAHKALYTTQEVVRVVGPVAPGRPFRPPLTYISFDIENSLIDRRIFCLCGVVETDGGTAEPFRLSGPEADILRGFFRILVEKDPDIITGYNIGGYDIPLMLERAQALGLAETELTFGRNRANLSEAGERVWRAHGRVVADAWWSARQILHPKQESLQFVSMLMLGEGKLDVDRRNMDQEWAKDSASVLEYCEHDARLALRILRKLKAIDRATDMASVANLYLEEGLNGRTSTLVDSLLVRAADRRKIGVPPTHRAKRDSQIEGGYVHTIKAARYEWVIVLDFKSMYPSIIISKNICFTTLAEDGETVAPTGAHFVTRERRVGLIPEILKDLMAQRDALKRKAKEATNPEDAKYYGGLQESVKILMNSFYGVLASSFYRFTNPDIGAAITAFARQSIKEVIDTVEADGGEVIYSDTDSIFVRSKVPTLEGARAYGEELSSKFSKQGATMEFQSVFSAFFSHGAKKRYVARQVWPKEEMIVRGYETRRTDSFELQVEALNEVFGLVLDGRTEEAVKRARDLVRQVREGQVPVEKLVVARSVRAESEYNADTKDALPFLRVFKKLKEEGYDVIPGMKVAWIVTDSRKTPQEVEPVMEGRKFEGTPDCGYYAERLAQTLARVTEVFAWDADGLVRGSRQRTLGGSPGDDEPAPPPPAPVGLDSSLTALGTPTGTAALPRKRRQNKLEVA